MKSALLRIALVAALAVSAGCSKEQKGECSTNADCLEYFKCQVDAQGYGTCLCTSELACAADEFCNPQGFCQKRQGCLTDADCPANFRCQIDTSG